ncbi:hypothetical protein BA065_00385 [Nanoarchaeota archaeon NZ13-N]|nr:MAG: hypothetical protein BA065_00385 [Nanoarchaeota archaeon NZ13-N]
MVGFVEAFLKALDSYKKHPLESIVFSIAYFLLGIVMIIPLLGAVIGAYLIPRLLSWFYNKTIGNTNTDYKLSFRVWLFYLLVTNSMIFQLFLSFYLLLTSVSGIGSSMTVTTMGFDMSPYSLSVTESYGFAIGTIFFIITLFIIMFQSLILQIFLTYSLYSVVLGKLSEFKVDVGKSLRVFGYSFGWGIILGIISYALGIIPVYGYHISLLFSILFVIPIIQLVIANRVISI